jgi:hypothetical protein
VTQRRVILGAMILAVLAGAECAGAQAGAAGGNGAAFPKAYAMLSAQAQKEKAAGDPGGRALQNAASTLYALNALLIQAPPNYGAPWADKNLTDARDHSLRLCVTLFNKQLIFVYRRDPKGAPVVVEAVRLIAGENGVALLKDSDFLTGTTPAGQVAYMRSSKVAAGEFEKAIWVATKDGGLAGPIATAPPRRPNPNAAANAQKPEWQAVPEFTAVYKSIQQLGPNTAGSFLAWTAIASEDQENGLPGEKNDHIGTGTLVFWWRPTIDEVNSVFRTQLRFALVQMQSARAGSGDAWLKQLYGPNNMEESAKAITALDGVGSLSDLGANRPNAAGNFHTLANRLNDLMTKVQYKAGAFYTTG